ncbi:MAG TPA: extracellular solute-binding protein [Candidatus Limivivens intestinipullorum]|uniref:Extracellular solute-binding protein n=1 Tax=Candidatus Limivivens intestinipullorum TaxID=2840858 RepID=A0A9D1JIQ9_9FIRM|nr:extracellular solute-binding protein [Candidatus Limivivens intestinipullorum]
MKRKMAMLLAGTMLTALFGGGCMAQAEEGSEKIEFPLEEKAEINICVQARTLHTTSFDEMPFVQMMEEMTNVHVNWTEYPETSWDEKINLDFASGNLADAYMTCYGMDDSTFMNYVEDGSIIAIDEIIARQAPHLTAKMEQYPQVRAQATALDGHIYGLPRYENDGNDIPCFMYINQTWLDELGLSVPTTTDELTEVLRAFKEQDPNGNGQQDEIPLAGIGDFSKQDYSFFNMFGMFGVATDMNLLLVENDEVKFAGTQEGWKDACKYFRDLYAEGLLDNETFTQGETQLTAKGSGEYERIGVLMGWNATNYVGSNYADDYVAIPYPSAEGYEAKMYKSAESGLSYNNFWVTSECENPDLVIAWLDFMNSSDEMTIQASFGMIADEENDYNLHYNDDGALEYWTGSPEGMTFGEYRHKWAPATSAYVIHDVAEMAENNIFLGNPNNMAKAEECRKFDEYAVEQSMPNVKFTEEETSAITNMKSGIMDQVLQMSARWIAGESDIDADWESYVSTLNGIGLEEYVSIYQTAYDRYQEVQ